MHANHCHPFTETEARAMHAAATRAKDHDRAEFFAAVIRSIQSGSPYKPGDRLKASGGKARRTA